MLYGSILNVQCQLKARDDSDCWAEQLSYIIGYKMRICFDVKRCLRLMPSYTLIDTSDLFIVAF